MVQYFSYIDIAVNISAVKYPAISFYYSIASRKLLNVLGITAAEAHYK
jgi:hypothetical protein